MMFDAHLDEHRASYASQVSRMEQQQHKINLVLLILTRFDLAVTLR